jgi:hypothetical protein
MKLLFTREDAIERNAIADKSPAGLHVPSWGNVFHFKQPEIFRTAYQMLQNMLPEDF